MSRNTMNGSCSMASACYCAEAESSCASFASDNICILGISLLVSIFVVLLCFAAAVMVAGIVFGILIAIIISLILINAVLNGLLIIPHREQNAWFS